MVGEIAIVLAGAFPLVFVVTKSFQKPLMGLGRLLGINDVAGGGTGGYPGQQYPHVRHGGRYGPPR